MHRAQQPVTAYDDELRGLVADMVATMYAADGVGLAACQIGVDLAVFVFDCPDESGERTGRRGLQPGAHRCRRAATGGSTTSDEGCLSFPGRVRPVRRGPTTPPSPAPASTASRSPSPATGCWPAACSTRPTTRSAPSSATGCRPRRARSSRRSTTSWRTTTPCPGPPRTADSMRRIVLFMSISVDGFMAGVDGDLSWHLVDDEVHRHFNEVLAGMSAFLDGRVTYELMADFWPTADEDPDAEPAGGRVRPDLAGHAQGRVLPHPRERRLEHPRSCGRSTRRRSAPGARSPAATWWSGAPTWRGRSWPQGLVDELRLYVHPVLVGRGKRLFQDADAALDFGLVQTRAFGNGVVLLHYARTARGERCARLIRGISGCRRLPPVPRRRGAAGRRSRGSQGNRLHFRFTLRHDRRTLSAESRMLTETGPKASGNDFSAPSSTDLTRCRRS